MSLKSEIAADITNIFLANEDEFAETHKIGTNSTNKKYSVIASLQSNVINNGNFDGKSPLQLASHTLLVAYPIGGELKVSAGQILFIDDVTYEVVDILDEMGMATILVKKGKERRYV